MAELRIGTSGWSYEHWKELFYPKNLSRRDWLEFYARQFDTVEINSSFYRLPKKENFENWAKKTPEDFTFSIKASRYLTHVKHLKESDGAVNKFIETLEPLGDKTGPILFQFPPNWKKDIIRLSEFLKMLPRKYRFVFEFRNNSWFDEETFSYLHKNNCAACFSSSPNFPTTETVTADFVFIRMHGAKILYGSKYSTKELEQWASKIINWLRRGLDCYIYFNNDTNAYAIENAKELKKRLKAKG